MTDDLISRQAVKDWLKRWIGYVDEDTITRMQYRVIDIPSSVVRCRECKHWEYDVIFQDGWCRGKHQGNPDWFCADGERREDDAVD